MSKRKLVCTILLCVLVLCGCQSGDVPKKDSNEEKDIITEEVFGTITPYCTLSLPKALEEKVVSEVKCEDPYIVTFMVSETNTPLFDIIFNGQEGDLLGTLKLKNENVILNVSFYDIDNQEEQYNDLQESLNDMIDCLVADYDFVVGERIVPESDKTFKIETEVVTLEYPRKWKESIDINTSRNKVLFSAGEDDLFAICFYECEGYYLGDYKDTPIYIIFYELDESNYSETRYHELFGMQEDINVIIDKLQADKDFVLHK